MNAFFHATAQDGHYCFIMSLYDKDAVRHKFIVSDTIVEIAHVFVDQD